MTGHGNRRWGQRSRGDPGLTEAFPVQRANCVLCWRLGTKILHTRERGGGGIVSWGFSAFVTWLFGQASPRTTTTVSFLLFLAAFFLQKGVFFFFFSTPGTCQVK